MVIIVFIFGFLTTSYQELIVKQKSTDIREGFHSPSQLQCNYLADLQKQPQIFSLQDPMMILFRPSCPLNFMLLLQILACSNESKGFPHWLHKSPSINTVPLFCSCFFKAFNSLLLYYVFLNSFQYN